MISKEKLIAFEDEVADRFNKGEINAPVHLSGGNEDQLIEIFHTIWPQDYVFSTWRSHYHALLKGIPRDEVMRQILAGRSMFISSQRHNFYASSIVGGCLSIAAGVAAAGRKVFCFVGDMCASTGAFHDTERLIAARDLPLVLIVEDNGLSTNTPTEAAWGSIPRKFNYRTYRYSYTRKHTHYATRQGPIKHGSF